ncbi:Uncharacterised protein [Serratia odorifera]|uniref:Transposase n=1 Tax=Serratia odorifera TaxID=618 RepID=A0A3S4DNH1_SEROD|nr:hypothetical protein [Serratia odorifera]PNK90201.1 hypothetical protein CEQ31_011065 [Serratia odorifera]RII71358.1 hypothetical protein DX901_15260 [Serratia odorifera]CAI1723744.1 Uncharacterised protein [Serratia ficaria]VDZ60544.1 Uncharacterised protein [Serratia odorifera]
MFIEQCKSRTKKYDEKLRPVVQELLSYGFGTTALANALNQREIPSLHGKFHSVSSVTIMLKRMGLSIERE